MAQSRRAPRVHEHECGRRLQYFMALGVSARLRPLVPHNVALVLAANFCVDARPCCRLNVDTVAEF